MVRISIIIPTYNEEDYIGETLRSIRRQHFKDIEVIVADNGSTDRTQELARKAYPGVRIVAQKRPGAARCCNKAAGQARGDLLLFIDADTSITESLLPAYEKRFAGDSRIVAATGPIIPLEKTTMGMKLGFSVVSVDLIRLFIMLGQPSIIGSNFMATREAFLKAGGYNARLVTYQDWDLSKRLGRLGKVAFVKEAVARTSIRRVRKWGMRKYFLYHLSNAIYYNLFHKAREDYEPIR